MAEAITETQDLKAALAVTQYDFDPDATSATDIEWVDMRDYSSILIGFFRTVGSSALTFKILANDASDGTGTDVTVKTVSPDAAPDAVGDHVWYEVNASEIRQACEDAGVDGRYVTANLAFATGTDEGVVTYVRKALHKEEDKTADVVA